MTAVSDSGPLIALAKLGVLSKLFSVYPLLTISETVYHEVVTAGSVIGAKDAAEVDTFSSFTSTALYSAALALQSVPKLYSRAPPRTHALHRGILLLFPHPEYPILAHTFLSRPDART